MRFSDRTAWQPGDSTWAEAVQAARAQGRELVDLTISNPTRCGLGPESAEVLRPLSAAEALQYDPEPFGMAGAREAVVAYYRDHACQVEREQICLTTSTSEAYSYLFRLLCDPGDEVLVAQPSYPLFGLLADLDGVALRTYPLFHEPGMTGRDAGAWAIDLHSLEAAVGERTRAILLVHPNNPTGHYASAGERQQLVHLCARKNLALIVDEVFLDYALGEQGIGERSFAGERECLCFVLSGISKICAMPQMKVSWIVTSGPEDAAEEALRRLEIVADTYLSINAPVQWALPTWLGGRGAIQERIRARVVANLTALDRRLEGSMGTRLSYEGGWTTVLRVPRYIEGETFEKAALVRGVLVQSGPLYGLTDGFCVLSLLTEPGCWERGLGRLPL